jgi:hypothetical protein
MGRAAWRERAAWRGTATGAVRLILTTTFNLLTETALRQAGPKQW